MAVGGIAVRQQHIGKIKQQIQEICRANGITDEVKWKHIREGRRFTAYKAIVDYFFSLHEANLIHYHSIFADTTRFDYGAVADCSKQTMLPRMYYQIILHRFARYYGKHCELHIRPDRSNDLKMLPHWQRDLNNAVEKRYGAVSPIKSIQLVDSKGCHLLQMNDLIIGAMGYYRNTRYLRPDAAAAKKEMAFYILGKSRLRSYDYNTSIDVRKLTVWNLSSEYYRKQVAVPKV